MCQACSSQRQIITIKGQNVYTLPKGAKVIDQQKVKELIKSPGNQHMLENATNWYTVNNMIIGLRYNPGSVSGGKTDQQMIAGINSLKSLYSKTDNKVIDISLQNFGGHQYQIINLSYDNEYFYQFLSNAKDGGYNLYGGVIGYKADQQEAAKKLLKDVLEHVNTN